MKRSSGIVAVLGVVASGLCAGAASGLYAGAASAGEGCGANAVVRHIFDAADADRDGRLSESEYESAGLARFGVSFVESDLDADGATSLAEYLELYRRYHPSSDEREV